MVHTIRGAFRDLNSKGRGLETFRKVWRGGAWQWVSGYLPRGTFLASERRASTSGDVETGEIVAEFSRRLPDRQCSIDAFFVVMDAEKPLKRLEYTKPRLGRYQVIVDGAEIDMPDPMARG